MSLVEHLEDLRRRVLLGAGGLLLASAAGLVLYDHLLRLLRRPVEAQLPQLVALTVLEPLLVKFKLALVFGIVVSFPWLLYQTLLFVVPAFTTREARYILPIAGLSLVLSAVGVVFGYFFVLPISTAWLLNQAGTIMALQISALAYVSYAVWFLAIFALAFQTPLVVVALVGLGLMSTARMRQEWRTVYLGLGILALLITPDWNPVSNFLVAAAMIGLYELSLLLVRLLLPGR